MNKKEQFEKYLRGGFGRKKLGKYIGAVTYNGHSLGMAPDEIWRSIVDFWHSKEGLERAHILSQGAYNFAEKTQKEAQHGK